MNIRERLFNLRRIDNRESLPNSVKDAIVQQYREEDGYIKPSYNKHPKYEDSIHNIRFPNSFLLYNYKYNK